MDAIGLIVLIVLLVVGVVFGGMAWVYRWLDRQRKAAVRQWSEQGVTLLQGPEPANYRGHLSQSIPVRGNGLLGLAPDALHVVRFVPKQAWVIPLDTITRVVLRRSWQGSRKGGLPVLGVYFQMADGQEDAVGVIVQHAPDWAQRIARTAGVPVEDER